MEGSLKRCWDRKDPLHIRYHDDEWGTPIHEDNKFFEFLVLGGFQAGLTWWIILSKRKTFRKAFDDFDPKKVANYSSRDVARLMENKDIIRNKGKILAGINNAKRFLEVQEEFGSFDSFIWRFVNGNTMYNSFEKLSDLPAETEESRTMSKELRKRGFQFVGPTICYAFMQATGLVSDHLVSCFRYKK